jgi:hypothetical protein
MGYSGTMSDRFREGARSFRWDRAQGTARFEMTSEPQEIGSGKNLAARLPEVSFAVVLSRVIEFPFYLREHPIAVHVLERRATPEEEALIAKNGAAFACPITSIICVNVANARAAATLDAKRKEIEVRRPYLGNEGSSQRYLLVAIPPSGAASILTVPAISSALR